MYNTSLISTAFKNKFVNNLNLDTNIAYNNFAENAWDGINYRPRSNDTEIKFIDWFFRTQWHKGNKFDIELESVYCPATIRLLLIMALK